MNADRAELSWDESKKKWLVRIIVGEEVIRRHCAASKDASPEELRESAVRTASEEGYQVQPDQVSVSG